MRKYVYLFFCGSVAGFLWEVLLSFFRTGQFINRGLLYGPWLPLYGIGALLFYILFADKDPKRNPAACFMGCALVGAPLELFSGLFLDASLSLRYWDYTQTFLHIKGYVCLASIIGIALGGTLFLCYGIPLLLSLWKKVPEWSKTLFTALFLLVLLTDTIIAFGHPNQGPWITF